MVEIERIIVKYLNQEANHSELENLEDLLKTDEGIIVFNRLVKIQYISTLSMTEFDINNAKSSIKARIKKNKRIERIKLFKKIAIAASVLLVIGLALYNSINTGQVGAIELEKQPSLIVSGSDRAILTLENGDEVALDEGEKYHRGKATSNGKELVYKSNSEDKNVTSQRAYNYLTIPRGGQFFVKLSDGTEVWLNSETKLKYPVEFAANHTREVELLYGEAYFKVSPSTKHSGAAFHVITKSQEIDVLGTEFNIKAYNDEEIMATTLVEGKIRIKKGKASETLIPNQQAKISHIDDEIDIEDIDVYQEISWINGLFTFNEKPLGEIMTILSRWYDTEVVFEKAKQKEFVFTGVLERTDTVEDILKLIKATSEEQIKFEINDKTIIIK